MLSTRLARPIYVISDLHLNGADVGGQQLLDALVDHAIGHAKTFIVLGDLFDVWVGDDACPPWALSVASTLKRLETHGLEVVFVPGNRDFLVHEDFCQRAGMNRLEGPIILSDTDPKIGLIHGDVLCTDDHAYQLFRDKYSNPDWQRKVLGYPRLVRLALAQWARWRSRRHGRSVMDVDPRITDVNGQAVDDFMGQYGVDELIHGHTHRLGAHTLHQGKQRRWVLGEWREGTGSVIVIDQSQISLHTIQLSNERTIHWSAPWQPPAH